VCILDNQEHRSIFILPKSMPTTIVTEVFAEPSWHQSALDGDRQDPVSKLRLSSDSSSMEIGFSTLEAALAVAAAIQDMVEDALDAVKSRSDLIPRVRFHVIKPPDEPQEAPIPF
jgi:hypothetical protein